MIHEHQNLNKIIERISRIYYFFKMRKQIENIIRKCNVCIWMKHSQHRFYELLKSLSTSDHAWKSIALNFIIKLSKSKEKVIKTMYNSILIITNRLIKYEYFLLYKKAVTNASELIKASQDLVEIWFKSDLDLTQIWLSIFSLF